MPDDLKFDDDKLRYELMPPDALEQLARVYTIGAKKYGPRSWERGIVFCRIFGALIRHAMRWLMGEDDDPEDGISHMAHAAWNCLALVAYQCRGMKSLDDRPRLFDRRDAA